MRVFSIMHTSRIGMIIAITNDSDYRISRGYERGTCRKQISQTVLEDKSMAPLGFIYLFIRQGYWEQKYVDRLSKRVQLVPHMQFMLSNVALRIKLFWNTHQIVTIKRKYNNYTFQETSKLRRRLKNCWYQCIIYCTIPYDGYWLILLLHIDCQSKE